MVNTWLDLHITPTPILHLPYALCMSTDLTSSFVLMLALFITDYTDKIFQYTSCKACVYLTEWPGNVISKLSKILWVKWSYQNTKLLFMFWLFNSAKGFYADTLDRKTYVIK